MFTENIMLPSMINFDFLYSNAPMWPNLGCVWKLYSCDFGTNKICSYSFVP